MHKWDETQIWQVLKERNDQSGTFNTIQIWMPMIEKVLSKGLTSPIDFTLHDEAHSFRVAERMASLAGNEQLRKASVFELNLLLLSAYLHDIGMTPSREKASKHRQYLTTGDRKNISAVELLELQKWLDKERPNIDIPISEGVNSSDGALLLEEVCAYYIRHKHNDWSEEWIRENLGDHSQTIYAGCVDDVVTICRSHHEGLAELRKTRFDARIVGSPAQTVNPRWISALLRLADVVEFDPERTPEVILEHRGIAPKSRIFWHKDNAISFSTDYSNAQIMLTARTKNAAIHKAVLSTADWVDNELGICSTLYHEDAFRRGFIPEDDRDRYKWPWPSRLTRDVREKDDSFSYIDGAFKPETKKILNLLSGTALYKENFAAFRELIQNAVDAVREQIAYERLQSDTPGALETEELLQSIHKIKISLVKEDERYWLICLDDGIGMDKQTIEKHLLISGSNLRAETKALERDAQSNGFSIGRTGQFGIGVLSYFMVADKLEIVTRRSQEAGDHDHTAWRFTTEGIGSFGELIRESRSTKGTEVKLRLSPKLVEDDPSEFIIKLVDYISRIIRRVPCKIEFRDEISSKILLKFGPGWSTGPNLFKMFLLSNFKDQVRSEGLLTREQAEAARAVEKDWDDTFNEASLAVRWFGPTEKYLSNGNGVARFWVPYFENLGSASVLFLPGNNTNIRQLPNGEDAFLPRANQFFSWRGFGINSKLRNNSFGLVEIDLNDGAEIEVSRMGMSIHDDAIDPNEILLLIKDGVKNFLREKNNRNSIY